MAVNPNIAAIIADGYDKIGKLSLQIVRNYENGYGLSEKQKELWLRIIKTTKLVRILSKFVEFDDNGDFVQVHRLTDTVVNDLLKYLIKVADLDNLPTAPKIFYKGPPAIRVAGSPGPQGEEGPIGPTGGGRDFIQLNFNADTVVDRFLLSEAKAAHWDYRIYGAAGSRTGTVRCHWSDDGLTIALPSDISDDDIGVTKGAIEFLVELDGTDIVLKADVSSGTWSVEGTRYWIPGNGTYVPPVSGLLPDAQIYVGDANNNAVGRTPGGVLAMTNLGVFSFVAGSIVNADVNAAAGIVYSKLNLTGGIINADVNGGAAIAYSKLNLSGGIVNADINASAAIVRTKLASGAANRLVINNGSGVMVDHLAITANKALVSNASGLPIASTTSDTQIGFLSNVTSDVQAQIDAIATGGVFGSGTAGVMTKFTSGTTIGNSSISEATLAPIASSALIQALATTSQGTQPYQVLIRNSANTGYEFINITTLKELLNSV